jgi:lipopolysaccharide export system protein LptA
LLLAASLAAPLAAQALTSDRDQEMNIAANYSSIEPDRSGNGPSVTILKGDVQVSQGTLKARADAATIEQARAGTRDAQGNDIGGQISHVVMTGEPAHMEQQLDGGGTMRASARRVDYRLATNTVELSGDVVVNQPGRGEFRGAHMTYDTLTGRMESGAESGGRVHMRIEPRVKPSPAPSGEAPAATDDP